MSVKLFFFPLLFSSYSRSADPRVVRIASGGCNQSSFAFLDVVFQLYRCVNAVFSYYYYYYFTLLSIFLTSVSWWFLTGVWVTYNHLNSPELFSLFWPIIVMDGFHLSSYFHFLQSLYHSFDGCTEHIIYNWYYRHSHRLQFFQFFSEV